MDDGIVNRVATSSLVTFDLEEWYVPGERVSVDIRDALHQGQILKEKEFREYVKAYDWEDYRGKMVAITCSVDAIVPTWAYMLLTTVLEPVAKRVYFGSLDEMESAIFQERLAGIDWEKYRDAKVVVKGCGKVKVPDSAYVEVTRRLRPVAASIMFGEPCSTVPLYKRPKA